MKNGIVEGFVLGTFFVGVCCVGNGIYKLLKIIVEVFIYAH